MEKELSLVDLIDVEVLQRIQDAFSALTGMAVLTLDVEGNLVTQPSNFTEFCTNYVRKSDIGKERCEKCVQWGVHAAWKQGVSTTYYCHAGLLDYVAPIHANGKLIGCFIGGQVFTKEVDEEQIIKVAEEIEVDAQELLAAARQIHVSTQEKIENAAQFLYVVANTISDIAYGKYQALRANTESERAANLKSDFLANMSHEIRTPMNAVIGMSEMALREPLTDVAKDYVRQIRASAKALLTIINDILDFSKIESGKMDILPVEYEPMSIVNDVSNIVLTRLKGKDVELILDVSPSVPKKLIGDNIRIKQVLLNIANNAVKFTSHGQVAIHMYHEQIADDEINLYVSVEDTGIGIKDEDLGKVFHAFEQVDSKRNRNIEGTGLGLAISLQLLTLMDGELEVKSRYEKGSTFSFFLPQKVVNAASSIRVKEPDSILAAGILDTPFIKQQLQRDCEYLAVEYRELASEGELADIPMDKNFFLFIEEQMFTSYLEEYIINNPSVTAILLVDADSATETNYMNLLLVKKPLYTLNEAMIFNRESIRYYEGNVDSVAIDFIAPTADILIVDDNPVNLTVAKGLLEPLKMKIDTALTGQEAISKISIYHYDIIFMDHMMPELDGVETTHIIRRFHKEYDDVPIIALTANAVEGVKEMFLAEGMNDFVPKPIEFKNLISKVKQWLPVEKMQSVEMPQNPVRTTPAKEVVVGDLDTKSAIRLLGSEKLFWTVLKDYYRVIDKKSKLIEELVEREAWADYTIEVHALKSSSRQIGAHLLAEKAAAMERAGNARNVSQIRLCTPSMLLLYRKYASVLKPYFEDEKEDDSAKTPVSNEELLKTFEEMQDALENLDFDRMDSAVNEMIKYSYEGYQEEMFHQLKEAVDDMDVDACEEIIDKWKQKLQ